MHEFRYKGNFLCCESIKIKDIAKEVISPFYLYSHKTIVDHFLKLKTALTELNPLICYSMKANSNLTICWILVKHGAGLDIVSGGELFKAQKTGVYPKRIVYASVGKTFREIRQAIEAGILFFNVESIPELELINKIGSMYQKKIQVAIRINPDIEPTTHSYITTGILTNKFGIDFKTARKIFLSRWRFRWLKICGVHIHIGSQIIKSRPFINAIKKVISFIQKIRKEGIAVEYLNIGGGLGIIYDKERPMTAKEFASKIIPILRDTGLKIILEPGRFIVGNAGVLVTKVLYIKDTKTRRFVIVDAGMNDLIRPALYGAYHEIIPVVKARGVGLRKKVDIVGPICESADFFAKARPLPLIQEGDYLAIMGAGAYGFSMSSNYNARPRVSEVMVSKDRYYIIRKRESYQDLIKGETIPAILK